jgi:S1-C subfamily serine protease
MVRGMRFCRMCGYRLGEGVEEYAETRLLDQSAPTAPHARPAQTASHNDWGTAPPMAPLAPMLNTTSLNQKRNSSLGGMGNSCRRMKMGWVMWVIISIAILTATGVITRGIRNVRRGQGINIASVQKSFLGVDGFDTADGGGALVEGIAGPDTPIERAGLIGGDIIRKFDGKEVADSGDMTRILAETPVGRTVEVIFERDGETKTTLLTTMAEKGFRGLRAFDSRPNGRGILGVDDLERVQVGDTKIYGVRLDEVQSNRPADIAGLKEGDIVIEFGGKPVRTPGDLRYRIYEAVPGNTVPVVVMRDGTRMEIPVKMGKGKD